MTVSLLYFDGCPHWTTMEERLQTALRKLGRDITFERRLVDTIEEADAVGFIGSPTMLIDGRDPFADPAAQPAMACRVYRTPDGLAGSPTVDQLVEVLR